MKALDEYIKGKRYKELVEIYRNIWEGKIRIADPKQPKDYFEYIVRLDYSLWLWTVVVLVILTLISIVLSNMIDVFMTLRYILGSIFVLFLPGYTTIEVLYPRERDLSSLERLALSIGLSLALVPLIGLILNYTPWGIILEPITVSLTIYTLVLAFIASYRKYLEIIRFKPIVQSR